MNGVRCIVVGACVVLSAVSAVAADEDGAQGRKIEGAKVVLLGDSLTTNNGKLGPHRGYDHWTDTVRKRFSLEIVNLGKGGSKADAGLERLRTALADGSRAPDFVLINFGMNDHKIRERDGEKVSTTENFERQLTEIVAASKEAGAIPILITPHKIHEGTPDDPGSYYSKYTPANFDAEGGALAGLMRSSGSAQGCTSQR